MTALGDKTVLLVDCQTTASSVPDGQVLELGWNRYAALDDVNELSGNNVNTRLIKLSGHDQIPRQITKLTGITDQDLRVAVAAEQVWDEFCEALKSTKTLVAHYASFETRFLSAWADPFEANINFERRFLCTHELSNHILNGLPRKGIRPVAGYWGHSMTDEKRSAPDVIATAVIWSNLIDSIGREGWILRITIDSGYFRVNLSVWLESISRYGSINRPMRN